MNFPLLFLPRRRCPLRSRHGLAIFGNDRRPVIWYFRSLPCLKRESVSIYLLLKVVSQGAPVAGYSLPSYLTELPPLMEVPSCRSPVTVVFDPAVRCLIHYRETLDRVFVGGVY